MDAPLNDESAIWKMQEAASSPSSAICQDQSPGDERCARRRLINYKRYPKPPYSYLAMIIVAIQYSPNGHMTLAEVIKALGRMFSFFCGSYKGWKDSVRHNISSSRCIVKVEPVPDASAVKAARWRVCWEMVPRDVFLLQRGRPGCKDKHWKPTLLQHLGLPDTIFPSERQDSSPSTKISNHSSVLCSQACLSQEPTRKSETSSSVAQYDDPYGIPTFSSFMVERKRNLRAAMTSSPVGKQVNNHQNLQTRRVPNIYDSTKDSPMPHDALCQSQIMTNTDFAEDLRTSPSYLDNFLLRGPRSPALDLPPIDAPYCDLAPIHPLQRADYPFSYSTLSTDCGTRLPCGQVHNRRNPRAYSALSDYGACTDGSDMETNGSSVQYINASHGFCTTSVECQNSVRTDLNNFVGMEGCSEPCAGQQPPVAYPDPGSLVVQSQCSQLPGDGSQCSSHCSIPNNNNINQSCFIDGRVSVRYRDPSYHFTTTFVAGGQRQSSKAVFSSHF